LNQEKQAVGHGRLHPRNFNPENITTFEDMVKMPILNEPEILNNIFVRFRRDDIYSYIGNGGPFLTTSKAQHCCA
jgi:myosin heavy subunit